MSADIMIRYLKYYLLLRGQPWRAFTSPAPAPSAAHWRPGSYSTSQVITMIQRTTKTISIWTPTYKRPARSQLTLDLIRKDMALRVLLASCS